MASGLLGRVAAHHAATHSTNTLHNTHALQEWRTLSPVRTRGRATIRRCVLPRGPATPSRRVMLPQRDDSTRRRTPQSTREEEREQTMCCTRTSARAQNRDGRHGVRPVRQVLSLSSTGKTLTGGLVLLWLRTASWPSTPSLEEGLCERVGNAGTLSAQRARVVMLPAANSSCVGARRNTRMHVAGGGVVALLRTGNGYSPYYRC